MPDQNPESAAHPHADRDPEVIEKSHQQFRGYVIKDWPGGEHVVEHIDDGPWQVVAVTADNSPNFMAQLAMAAYPCREAVSFDGFGVHPSRLYLMPKFPARLMEWYNVGDGELELNEDINSTEFVWADKPEGERAWIQALLVALCYPDPLAGAAQLDDTRECFDMLAHFAAGLEEGQADEEAIDAFIAAWETPTDGV